MGNGMNKVLPGLFVGNFRDAKDRQQLADNNITHILAIHDQAKKLHEDKEYLCIVASDNSQQELIQFFPECIEFIHNARLNNGSVLVHCLAGVSRSVTITAAYIMTVTPLGWREAVNSIRGVRNGANPNFGFQKQLMKYQNENLQEAKQKFRKKFPESDQDSDYKECQLNLNAFQKFVLNGSPTKDDGLYPLPYNAYKTNNSDKDKNTGSKTKTEQGKQEAQMETKGDNSGKNMPTNISDTTSALSHNNDLQNNQTNRNKTVDFDSLTDDIDEAYACLRDKKVL
ncbi:atypical dual specificity phosphatase [Mytilus galloprovincialis]|uniref:Dual specificity protein phosphatase 15 n=1 Tax=Mytilus galloprovincialis TaxID=29158 RepID=A0A8B6F0H2_MYTGA|nr:atypical dual specificity phosphatase [Mytilus galloprovincialis]